MSLFGWIDLETAWRFTPPLSLGQQPRRVFLCCDPDWPGPEVELFGKVFDAAVAAGWKPREEEQEPVTAGAAPVPSLGPEPAPEGGEEAGPEAETVAATEADVEVGIAQPGFFGN